MGQQTSSKCSVAGKVVEISVVGKAGKAVGLLLWERRWGVWFLSTLDSFFFLMCYIRHHHHCCSIGRRQEDRGGGGGGGAVHPVSLSLSLSRTGQVPV